MAGRSNLESLLLYGGGFLLTYYVLKSWGIIATSKATTPTITGYASVLDTPRFNWKPLTNEQLNYIRSKV